jgi:hypothetical protein
LIDIDIFAYWANDKAFKKKNIFEIILGIQLDIQLFKNHHKPSNVLKNWRASKKLRYYNYTHDLGILELLVDKMEGDIHRSKYY